MGGQGSGRYPKGSGQDKSLAGIGKHGGDDTTGTQKESSFTNKEKEEAFSYVKEIYGTTNDLNEAGFILPDGSLLDMSGKNDEEIEYEKGTRQIIHQDIRFKPYQEYSGVFSNSMQDFQKMGAIRIDAQEGLIDIVGEPTEEQYKQLKNISSPQGKTIIDVGDGKGRKDYIEFDEWKPVRITGFIKKFFNKE